MYVLGIESSCDETSASIVSDKKEILSNVIYSQIKEHESFLGVVPEIAARAHLEKIDKVFKKALQDANISGEEIDAVAATSGPGLIGGLIVGSTFAKTISWLYKVPFIAINHIEAHALCARLTENINFPYLLMLMSGGHCQICIVHSPSDIEVIGKTLDDSVGEAFDKVAKMLNLGYPGGPQVEKFAKRGDSKKFDLPKPLCTNFSCDFSFSGLKTATRIISENIKSDQGKYDLCASFQQTVVDVFKYKIKSAIKFAKKQGINISSIVIAGGVASNTSVRTAIKEISIQNNLPFFSPPVHLCTDNAAMIAWLGVEKLKMNETSSLDFSPRPKWPFEHKISI